ncbi:hypothetical protein JN11_00851 [Mucilaginibacter frigoritolerans]|uniref:Methylamine utilisation protein MauE domain-containing protein n=1 Tax=Mucilaginibacter frigoritolerans TaxID=652788 RepID=A0A562UBY1_9SPHI|nr:MauE/DoxX family redox-associated membrane protein [Mucilaginibacter frigoritolerans]TWJ03313.1 hypothetical protein JN11_00851 [Mucilaginibacter frigoritolerans]
MDSIISKKQRFRLTNKGKDRLILAICSLCIFLFLYTACAKLMDHGRFLNGLYHVEVIGRFAFYISWLVPLAEILIAILLIIPRTLKLGLYSFLGLMILFTVYILSVLLWASKLPCHCGGVIEKLSWTQHVWFNLTFIALAVCALRLLKTKD